MIFLKNKVVLFGLIAMLTGCLTACGESKTEVNTNLVVEEDINISDGDTDSKADESAEVIESIEAVETVDTVETTTEAEVSEGADTNQEDAIPTDNTGTDDSVSSEPDFTVADMSMTMYANQSVNVRSGPSTDYDKLGGLSANDEVKITGQADTGWYRIEYKGGEAYVSNSYLVSEKVEVKQPTETPSNSGGNSENNSAKYKNDYGQTYGMTPQEVAAAFGQPIGTVIDGSYYYYIVSHIRGVDGIGFHALDNSFDWRIVGGTAYIVQTYDNGNFEVWKQSVAPN